MDRRAAQQEYLQSVSLNRPSTASSLLSASVILYLLLLYFRYPVPALHTLLVDFVVFLIPRRLLLHRAQRQDLERTGMLSHTHAAKKEALSGIFGLGGATLLSKLPAGASDSISAVRRASTSVFSRPQQWSDAPAGLGNWDNSCYQNSVLQGFASLATLRRYLGRLNGDDETTSGSLLALTDNLNDAANNGQQLWTPAKLKNMSSWQQQDAQEYYSKILDQIDREAIKANAESPTISKPGLESLVQHQQETPAEASPKGALPDHKSPLDGLLAQKVTCTRCGFSEGLSMIPFNCLTLPIPPGLMATDIAQCLGEYTNAEEITEVECMKCTLVHAKERLEKMLPGNPGLQSTQTECTVETSSKVLQLPPELRARAFQRLAAVQQALEEEDFSDQTVSETCQIGKKARVSSTKTRQALVARAPQCLVMHVNRSVFDESTGVQRKNYATVGYPRILDLAQWMGEEVGLGPNRHGEELLYTLKAVVTHYGRHENGHYISYRQHPRRRAANDDVETEPESWAVGDPDGKDAPWYRLSDEDVTPVNEADVLGQGGVFMLFYERQISPERPPAAPSTAVAEFTDINTTAHPDDESIGNIEPPVVDSRVSEELQRADKKTTPTLASAETEVLPTSATPVPLSSEVTIEDEHDGAYTNAGEPRRKSSDSLVRMRTARMPVIEHEFGGSAFRAVAAT